MVSKLFEIEALIIHRAHSAIHESEVLSTRNRWSLGKDLPARISLENYIIPFLQL